jgi:uncharacterized membrane protein (UPF0127 family)
MASKRRFPAGVLPVLGAILFLAFTPGCSAQGQAGKTTGQTQKLEPLALTLKKSSGGEVTISAEIARTAEERAVGLMNRTALPDGEGMLFVFDRDEQLSFWMKNTLIPLSIAFITREGRILEIRNMAPRDLSAIQSSRSVRYALEVPQGWFDRTGLAPGDLLDLEPVLGN